MKNTVLIVCCLAYAPLFAQIQPITYSTTTAKGADANLTASANTGISNAYLAYIDQYKAIAISEMERVGIPASITLAQGVLESNAGQSDLAQSANNHFGIKCGGDWTGRSYRKKDDEFDGSGSLTESCFRRYDKAEESFYDHSEFLRDPRKYNRYGFLFNLDRTDYKGWAKGLQASGYATSQTYADNLISVVERYQLYQYDQPGPSPVIANKPGNSKPGNNPNTTNLPDNSNMEPLRRIGRVNDVRVVLAQPGESLRDIARLYDIKPDNLVEYNDMAYAPGDKLQGSSRIYIQKKRNHWRGKAPQHFVIEGQTMFDIAQQYGVKLAKLYRMNNMEPGQQPAEGERIYLKYHRSSADPVKLANPGARPDPAPISTEPGKLTPDDDYLFDNDNNSTTSGAGNQPTGQPVFTGKPATTGVPLPKDPVPVPVATQPDPTPVSTGSGMVTPTPTPMPSATGNYYTVAKGDTLYNLAKRFNTTPAKIKQLNSLPDDTIRIGQILRFN